MLTSDGSGNDPHPVGSHRHHQLLSGAKTDGPPVNKTFPPGEGAAPSALTLQDLPIKSVAVDERKISKFQHDQEFMPLAVELLKEVGHITSLLACSYRLDENNQPRKWRRNEAIVGGLFVRLVKLQMGVLGAVCDRHAEIADILFRCLSETILNIRYLILKGTPRLYDEFVEYSLREEKRLLQTIKKNIKNRGRTLPIEQRMISSIQRAFKQSGVNPKNVDESKRTPWGENIFKRAEAVGYGKAYQGIFGLPSHSVHGNWQDLIHYHLEMVEEFYIPTPEWTRPRPQPVFVAALLSAEVGRLYLNTILPDCPDKQSLMDSLEDCIRRIRIAENLHEKFLQRRRTP